MKNQSFRTHSYEFINYVSISDSESKKIWAIRNRPEIANWMVNSELISLENHLKFIDFLKESTAKDYFLIKDKQGNLIGSVNICYTTDGYSERGIFINPAYFHQNHAYRSMTEFYDYAKRYWGIKGFITKVKKTNIASNKLEYKLGATFITADDSYNFYRLELQK